MNLAYLRVCGVRVRDTERYHVRFRDRQGQDRALMARAGDVRDPGAGSPGERRLFLAAEVVELVGGVVTLRLPDLGLVQVNPDDLEWG
jgi:hypothetical protein